MVKNDNPEVLEGLRKHFQKVHPILFVRSTERAKSVGDLFDILDTIPDQYPIIWDNEVHKWIETDLLQANEFEKKAELCYRKNKQ